MKKVAITTTSFAKDSRKPLEILENSGFEIILNPHGRKLESAELVDLCEGALGIIAGTERIDADTLGKLKSLKVISRCGVGIENVDLKAAKNLGIKVCNTPDAPTLSVAELTIGLMLNLLRKIGAMDRAIRAGKWSKLNGNLISGKKVGIVGFGRIGKKVAGLLGAFGCEIKFADPLVQDGTMGCAKLSLGDLLAWADIVSIHVSAGDRLVSGSELALMKKSALVLNLSRGGVIDEDALYNALKNGKIAGAALDVFEKEPYNGPFKGLDNVILTPHIGSYAVESRVEMEMQAAQNLIDGLRDNGRNI